MFRKGGRNPAFSFLSCPFFSFLSLSDFFLFVIVGLFSFCHCRAFFFLSLSGLTRQSKKYKAGPYDMHIESSALQQRFVPQPIMRSSWLQLVMFGFEPDISLIDPRDACRPRMTLGETRGLNPNMTIVYLSFSDCLPS